MPCHSDGPTQEEINCGVLNALLDEALGEASGKLHGGSLNEWARHISQRPTWSNDRKTRVLCRWCRHHRVTDRSLELQIWWRNHQRADAHRHAEQRKKAEVCRLQRQALNKLTRREREAFVKNMLPNSKP